MDQRTTDNQPEDFFAPVSAPEPDIPVTIWGDKRIALQPHSEEFWLRRDALIGEAFTGGFPFRADQSVKPELRGMYFALRATSLTPDGNILGDFLFFNSMEKMREALPHVITRIHLDPLRDLAGAINQYLGRADIAPVGALCYGQSFDQ